MVIEYDSRISPVYFLEIIFILVKRLIVPSFYDLFIYLCSAPMLPGFDMWISEITNF